MKWNPFSLDYLDISFKGEGNAGTTVPNAKVGKIKRAQRQLLLHRDNILESFRSIYTKFFS